MWLKTPLQHFSLYVGVSGPEIPYLLPSSFTHCYKRGVFFCFYFQCLHLTASLLSVPSEMSLAEEQWKGGLTALLPFSGILHSTLDPFAPAFSSSKLCFAQGFLKAVLIQCFHCGLQEHETRIYINLRHINFASIMSDKSLIFSKDTGAVCKFRMSHYFVTFGQPVAQDQKLRKWEFKSWIVSIISFTDSQGNFISRWEFPNRRLFKHFMMCCY